MHRAEITKGFRQQLAHLGGLHGREELTAMHAAKVRNEAQKVQSLGHDTEARFLVAAE